MKKQISQVFVVSVYDPNFDANVAFKMNGIMESKVFSNYAKAEKYFVLAAVGIGAEREYLDDIVEKNGCYYDEQTGAIVQMDELIIDEISSD